VEVEQPKPPKPPALALFSNIASDDLLSYGVPKEWLEDVSKATEDTLFSIAERLPHEAAEALLELATGGKPQLPQKVAPNADPFTHPDAQRRFRVVANVAELERALDYPWEKWTVFLHPAQRSMVERDYSGPVRISGSAGTGKTIVALHRAVFLARAHPDARVLLTTFSETLANALRTRLRRLIGNEPKIAERLEVHSLAGIGQRLYESNFEHPTVATTEQIRQRLVDTTQAMGAKFTPSFLFTEWTEIVDAWQLKTWDEYRDVKRLGRKTRLSEKQRVLLWSIFKSVRSGLTKDRLITSAEMFSRAAERIANYKRSPFEYVVVDEAQDVGVAELRFLAALGGGRSNSLFFTGDLGQRIFQQPFSWKALGVDIRGRSHTLKINYRTSHQIRQHADRLLPTAIADVDGNTEGRRGAISIFEGIAPTIQLFGSNETEIAGVGAWIGERIKVGVKPHEIGVFARAKPHIERALAAVKCANIPAVELDDLVETRSGCVSVSTMHLAKGLEFRAVVVMACDEEILPLQERVESVSDDSDLEEVYNTERHLLYVACTRARDFLLVTGVKPGSEFLADFKSGNA